VTGRVEVATGLSSPIFASRSTLGHTRCVARTAAEVFDVDQRVAIVTGASSGIGEHLARTLAAGGMRVIAAARRLDVVVNNAGVSDAPTKAEEETAEEFSRVVDINLNACFLLARSAAAAMIDAGAPGSIINIASVHGFVASAPNNQAGYVASKAGLIGLTRELAGQWARHDIRVNCIAPGYFPSELTDSMMEEGSRGLGYITKRTPMRRPGRLDELDGALLLLASDASTFLTGQTVTVDGGWTLQ